MFAAFLTTLLFSISVSVAARSVDELGTLRANVARMVVALVALGLWAHSFGYGLGGPGFTWFLISGGIGFGLGDLALFQALVRVGPRLTILLAQCLAAPIAIFTEWVWLGTTLRPSQLLCAGVILGGVAIAMFPEKHLDVARRRALAGTIFGVVAAVGQALGAVLSRKAYQHIAATGGAIDAGTAAYQRMVGGIVVTTIVLLIVKASSRSATASPLDGFSAGSSDSMSQRWRRGLPWVILNGLVGPSLGVGCYQWALSTTPSGIVLPIIATTPIVTIPFAYFINGDVGGRRSIIGGAIAVIGAVALSAV